MGLGIFDCAHAVCTRLFVCERVVAYFSPLSESWIAWFQWEWKEGGQVSPFYVFFMSWYWYASFFMTTCWKETCWVARKRTQTSTLLKLNAYLLSSQVKQLTWWHILFCFWHPDMYIDCTFPYHSTKFYACPIIHFTESESEVSDVFLLDASYFWLHHLSLPL